MHFLYFFIFKKHDVDGNTTDRCVKVGKTGGSTAIDQMTYLGCNNDDLLLLNASYFRCKEICESDMRGWHPKIKFCIQFPDEMVARYHERSIHKILRDKNLQKTSQLKRGLTEYFVHTPETSNTVYNYFRKIIIIESFIVFTD